MEERIKVAYVTLVKDMLKGMKMEFDPGFFDSDQDMANGVMRVLKTFSEKERNCIELRYGLRDGNSLTFKRIGEECGYSDGYMKAVFDKTLRRLQHPRCINLLLSISRYEFERKEKEREDKIKTMEEKIHFQTYAGLGISKMDSLRLKGAGIHDPKMLMNFLAIGDPIKNLLSVKGITEESANFILEKLNIYKEILEKAS